MFVSSAFIDVLKIAEVRHYDITQQGTQSLTNVMGSRRCFVSEYGAPRQNFHIYILGSYPESVCGNIR